MALTLEDVDRIIRQVKPDVMKRLDLNYLLQAELERVGVITTSLKDELQPKTLTPHEKKSILLDSIKTGPIERFLNFCRTLHSKGQGHLLQIMGEDIQQITAQLASPGSATASPGSATASPGSATASAGCHQKQHVYRDMDTQHLLPIPTDALPAILQQCSRSVRMLMRTTLFGFGDEIPLDLAALYIGTKVQYKTKKSIGTKKLFMRLTDKHTPYSLLLEGEAGSGKTSFLNDYAHSMCKDLVDCHNKGPDVPCTGHEWKLVVFIPAGAMEGVQEEAIKEHLECDDNHKDLLMTMIKDEGQGILIINDGADELREQAGRESMHQYTLKCQKTGLPKVLVSSRKGLCHIEPRFFDRFLFLRGFSLEEGIEYMENYFRVRYNLTPQHPVLRHVEQHKEDFDWVLCNPLRLHIFSELTAAGVLKLQDIPKLSTIKLLKTLDSYILTRDEECRNVDAAAQHSECFFKTCLNCLLTDMRQISESALTNTSPYLFFLNPQKKRGLLAKATTYYSFVHEIFLEYFSVEGLLHCLRSNVAYKNAMLLYLCCNVNMWNVLKLTSEYICKYDPDLLPDLTFIVQACLILQTGTEKHYHKKTPLTEGLLQLPAIVRNTFPRDVLSRGHLSAEQTRILGDVQRRVLRAFREDAEELKKAGWLFNGFDFQDLSLAGGLTVSAYQEFLRDLQQHCTPTQQEKICSKTTQRLLPCTVQKSFDPRFPAVNFYMLPVSTTHWSIIHLGYLDHIYVWCPQDIPTALSALTDHYSRQLPPYRWVDANINVQLGALPALWGEAPGAWSIQEWIPAFRELVRHQVGGIIIWTEPYNSTSPLDGLLQAAQEVVSSITPYQHLGVLKTMWGCVREDVLCRFVQWARQASLNVELDCITVVESEQPVGAHPDIQHRVEAVLAGSTTTLTIRTDYQRTGGQLVRSVRYKP